VSAGEESIKKGQSARAALLFLCIGNSTNHSIFPTFHLPVSWKKQETGDRQNF
jgi:hypothetical protein